MELLCGFAALSLVSSALISLLGEGPMRQAASMAAGLLMLVYWAAGIQSFLQALPDAVGSAPATALIATGVTLPSLEAALLPQEAP